MARTDCPACGAPCRRDDRFCKSCGSRLGAPRLGRRLPHTQDEGQPPEHEPFGLCALCALLEVAPGLASPKVVIMSVLAVVLAAGFSVAALVILLVGVLWLALLAAGFALLCYWTAVIWVLYGEACLPSDALADFVGVQWVVFLILGSAPIWIGLALMGLKRS